MENYTKSLTTNVFLLVANFIAITAFVLISIFQPTIGIFATKLLYVTISILFFILADRFLFPNVNTLEEIIGIYNYETKQYEKKPNIAFGVMLFALAYMVGSGFNAL